MAKEYKFPEGSDEFYREEGIAIYVKGECIIGLHPYMLAEKLKKLNDQEVDFDWEALIDPDKAILGFDKKKKGCRKK